MSQCSEAEPVAAHAKVFEMRVSDEERRHVRLFDPGNLMLLADDIAEEERAQRSQTDRRSRDRLARVSERPVRSPHMPTTSAVTSPDPGSASNALNFSFQLAPPSDSS